MVIRSKLNISSFPFDDTYVSQTEQQTSCTDKNSKLLDGYLQHINCSFELYKVNSLYHFNVDLRSEAVVEKLKLFFEQDNKSLFKISLRILAPDSAGNE